MLGWWPGGNSTSTTAPMIWVTRPTAAVVLTSVVVVMLAPSILFESPRRRSQRLGPAHDLHQLGGDAGLADLVGGQGVVVDQLAGRFGGVLHGDHPGGVLAGLVLEQGLVYLALDVTGQKRVQHLLRLRLVDVLGGGGPDRLPGRDLDRDQGPHHRLLA